MKTSFGQMLYEGRSALGISAAELSDATTIVKNAIHNIESGTKRAGPRTALVLVEALGVGQKLREKLLIAHAEEFGAVDVSTLDDAGRARVVRAAEAERRRVCNPPTFVPRGAKQRQKTKRNRASAFN